MTWDEVIRNAMWLYYNRDDITYCLGCSGEVAGRDKNVENQFKYYYGSNEWKYKIGASIPGWAATDTADQAWNKWLNIHKGKMTFDCSGFIDWCIGFQGIHKYSSWDFGNMTNAGTPSSGPAGGVLFKQGHVGLDIGYGYNLEIGAYGHTIELNKISLRDFKSSRFITGIDYVGSDGR